MKHIKLLGMLCGVALLSGCTTDKGVMFPDIIEKPPGEVAVIPAPVIRQPVLPEMLVNCRGHVLVPALGMTFVKRGGAAPPLGQFVREENLTPPYRVLLPGDRMSMEFSPQRLNVELDTLSRVVGLYCG